MLSGDSVKCEPFLDSHVVVGLYLIFLEPIVVKLCIVLITYSPSGNLNNHKKIHTIHYRLFITYIISLSHTTNKKNSERVLISCSKLCSTASMPRVRCGRSRPSNPYGISEWRWCRRMSSSSLPSPRPSAISIIAEHFFFVSVKLEVDQGDRSEWLSMWQITANWLVQIAPFYDFLRKSSVFTEANFSLHWELHDLSEDSIF